MNKKENIHPDKKILVIPLDFDLWKSFRKVAFDQEVSMSQLTRDAIEKIIKKHEKGID